MQLAPECRARLASLGREAALLTFFLALAVFHTGLWHDPSHRVGPSGDSPPVVASVNWISRHLLTAPTQVYAYNVFFPYPRSGALFEPMLGPSVLVAPLTPFVANPILLFNLAVLLVLTTMSYGAYRLGLRLLADPALAILAAVAIPYGGQQTGHYAHINVLGASGFPFLILGLVRLLERPSIGGALLTGLAFGLQAGTSGYHAISAAALVAILLAWRPRRLLDAKTLAHLVPALVLGAAIVLPWAWAFTELQGPAGLVRTVEQSRNAGLNLQTFFSSPSRLWQPILGANVDAAFPGAVVTLLGILGFFVARGPYAWLMRAILVGFVVMALGPEATIAGHRVPLPFGLVWKLVPMVRACRHPLTFVVPGMMALVYLALMGLTRLGWARRRVVVALLGAAIVAETFTSWPLVRRELGLPPIYQRLRELPAGAFLEVPAGGENETEWQWRSLQHGLPVVNGWSPFVPRLQAGLFRLMKRQWTGRPARDLSATRALEYLKRHFPIRYVLVHGDGWTARSIARTPSFVLLAEDAHQDRIYRLVRSGTGRRIERHFREGALSGHALQLRLTAPAETSVTVRLNDQIVAVLAVHLAERDHAVPVPDGLVQDGLNAVILESPIPVTLVDIETAPR